MQRSDWLTGLLFFISGIAALMYQVLWMRELGLLFGNTAEAAATTIALFFAGIAAGGWFWGRRAARYGRPLAAFGALEAAVAVTALLFFWLSDAYALVYPWLHDHIAHLPGAVAALKLILSAVILLPPAFLMGGTFPLLAQHFIRRPQTLARGGSLLYALNTFGGMTGAFLAAFVLPMLLGFRDTYLLAITLDALVAVTAVTLAYRTPVHRPEPSSSQQEPRTAGALNHSWIWALAFLSGLLTLAVEVLWTRMYAQVLQNSVYTYASVLILFLASLGLGSLLANRLAATAWSPRRVTPILLVLGGLVTMGSAWAFQFLTDGLSYVQGDGSYPGYLWAVFRVTGAVVLPAGLVLGALLPYLLRSLQGGSSGAGRAVGQLVAANTLGAILGALIGGFVLLRTLGLWSSLQWIGIAYLLLAAAHYSLHRQGSYQLGMATGLGLAVLLVFLPMNDMRSLTTAPGEQILAVSEGSHAHAAVVERDGHRLIRVNNFYRLGGTGAMESERNQGRIPLMLHPEPDSVFFLGLGTGITAGAAVDFPLQRIRVCELLPEVIELAERWFEEPAQGLFSDPRVEILAEDGRNCLMAQPEQYDVIISDLFTPWKAGTGNLYTVEHYEQVRERLNEGGLFAQWLPLYQLSEEEFSIIARSMQKAFPQVVLWRGDMYAEGPIIALVGYKDPQALDPEGPLMHGRRLAGDESLPEDGVLAALLRFYAGNLGDGKVLGEGPVNRDNFPVIEYRAPLRQGAGDRNRFVSMDLARFYERVFGTMAPEDDPYLDKLSDTEKDYARAGLSYYRYVVLQEAGEEQAAQLFLNDFLARTPFEFAPPEEDDQAPTGWEGQ